MGKQRLFSHQYRLYPTPEQEVFLNHKNGIPLGDLSHAKMESADTEMEILTSGKGKFRYAGYRPITVYIPKQGTFTYHVFDVEEL